MAKKKKYHKSPQKTKNKEQITREVVRFFNRSGLRPFNYKQIAADIRLHSETERQLLINILDSLVAEGFLTEESRGKYQAKLLHGLFAEGRFERRRNGKNFFVADGSEEQVFVAERNSKNAMNGDRVRLQYFPRRKNKDAEGIVTEILERKQTTFVGTLSVQKHYAFLILDSKTLANDIFVPGNFLGKAKDGDKVLAEVVEWPEKAKNPIGRVLDILGKPGDNTTEMHAILAEFGLPYKYPDKVEKAAARIPEVITDEEVARREDFRNITTFTIDPKDAKDFDDALSIRRLENGNYEVGVHIADVTHYVKEGSIIDEEAVQRATSVYLVDRTIPMLPERLSNGLCSLRPNEEKLSFACIFEMDDNADVKNYRIARTVICSDRRFTYEEAQNIIETGEGDFKDEVLKMNDLAKKLRQKRFDNGAIAFDRHEVKFEIDEQGKPLGVYFKVAKDANKLVEEFMLLANKTVAEFIGKPPRGKKAKTFVYRVHDLPDPTKLQNLSEFIVRFGYKIKTQGSDTAISKSINKLLNDVQSRPEENLIETIAIRSMAKATYTTANIGHYGLAFPHYTHFTSPIRRYPDMMVHRLLERYLNGGRSVNKDRLEDLCKHSSEMEQLAANAERTSIKYKQVEYMADKLGQTFDGVISGITEWGIYVEIKENMCEGMIPIRELDDDFYEFDEKNYCLRGQRSKKEYRLGDEMKIQVVRANLERRQLDFVEV